jgi:hypothetical protein
MKWEIWSAKAPVIEDSKASFKHQTSNIKHQINVKPRMKWEIWGVKAPVIEDSKASSKHQNHLFVMKWEIWGAKAPVIEDSKTSSKHQTTWEIWGAKAPVTREFEAVRLTNLSIKQFGRPGVLRPQ